MNRRILSFLLICAASLMSASAAPKQQVSNPQKLWFNKPADKFVIALPIGNSRLGAMIYGRPQDDIVNLNEETLWSGGPVNKNPNPDAYKYLPQVREALNKNDLAEAERLIKHMQGLFTESYSPVGDLLIHQDYKGKVTNYYRDLNLENAVATVRFHVGNVAYTREAFVSYPDQAIIIRFTSSQKGMLNIGLAAASQLHPTFTKDGNTLVMAGRAPAHADPSYYNASKTPVIWDDPDNGMRVQTRIKVLGTDGTTSWLGDTLRIAKASAITVAVSIGTSYNGYDKHPYSEGRDEAKIARNYMDQLSGKSYAALKSRHIADYTHYYDKVRLYIKGNTAAEQLPTDERMLKYQTDKSDVGLEALLYNFGRYLIISSTRKGGIAANLQGIWNVDLRPAWSCNYTTNINLEMNYWGVDKVGLDDMSWPLVDQVKHMAETGKYTAWNFCRCRGWMAAHNSDIWAETNPVGDGGAGDPQWANWVMAGPWLCQNLWDKYAYNCDKTYLRDTAYPLMKGAAQFCLDWLIDDGNGHLITSPATSPENRFLDENHKAFAVSKGNFSDISLIRNLFEHVMESCKILNIDPAFADTVRTAFNKLLPYKISSKGYLQEWVEDYAESEPTHRHTSHLICLHPGADISAWGTPDLFNACKETLKRRGDIGTGWSEAWRTSYWARLLDGNHAHTMIQKDLTLYGYQGNMSAGGTYSNLLNSCPPFQIDGNYGIVEGISEMLLQSHLGEIHLLPALPDAWANGYLKGIKGRGGYTVNLEWANGKLKAATLTCIQDNTCRLRTSLPVTITGANATMQTDNTVAGTFYLYTFKVDKNKVYRVKAL
jgi:alpha-L-fucosidase 2